ncbi:anti-sigma factor family protein [Oricola cellulosilytica]|uniref:Anti-sigma factor n=1 Tax=Oricola cellulosilytica TaxID=1429082 RepID=A0A4R0P614_9HYPH|nr:anti-sigma factor [Oricola cellulosilytica]TCD11348.1 anti-sigma factor [Oricola cellulosilytica]
MTDQSGKNIGDDELHAYVDGELDPGRRAEVEAFLASDTEAAALVAKWRAQNTAIRGMFGEAPLPERATDRMMIRKLGARRSRWTSPAIAAGFALFFLAGTGAGALVTRMLDGGGEAAFAQVLPEASKTNYLIYASEVRHPVEVRADEEEHLVNWLGARVGRKLFAPDLSSKGFRLVGGRLVPFVDEPGAMLMYENAGSDRLTVLIGSNPQHEGTGFRFASQDGVSTFYWTDDSFGYAMSGALDREILLGLARIVYAQY